MGKTSLANALIEQHKFRRLKSSHYLKDICASRGMPVSRASLQAVGDELDEATDFRWLIDDVALPQMGAEPEQHRWLVDSVRKPRQIEHFRTEFGGLVLHVHLWASEASLRQRYDLRRSSPGHAEGLTPYDVAIQHPNEVSSRALKGEADVAVLLERIGAIRAACALAHIGDCRE